MSDYYNESILDLETLKKAPPPHIVHTDSGGLFPTHTHGLNIVNLPEMFINHKAFGSVDNCATINEIFVYLMLNSSEFNKVIEGTSIEVQLWPKESDLIMCVRKVLPSFSGVSAAYSQEEITGDVKGFRQIYVKDDDHVLTSEYFNDIIKKLDALPDACTCGQYLGGE
jgi:hypothetical protein